MRCVYWGNWGMTFLGGEVAVARFNYPTSAQGPVENKKASKAMAEGWIEHSKLPIGHAQLEVLVDICTEPPK